MFRGKPRWFWSTVILTAIVALNALTMGARVLQAQDFSYYDNFDDNDISPTTEAGFYMFPCGQPNSRSSVTMASGDMVMEGPPGFFWTLWCTGKYDGASIPSRQEWSVRSLITLDEPDGIGVGTSGNQHVALIYNGQKMSVGTLVGSSQAKQEPMPYPVYGETLYFQMDAFDGNVTGSIWRDGDPDSLIQYSYPYSPVFSLPAIGLVGGSGTFHDLWLSSRPIPIFPLSGDFNDNGVYDVADVDLLVDEIATSRNGKSFDLNSNDIVDNADLASWLTLAAESNGFSEAYLPGDANLDGTVNSTDLNRLALNWTSNVALWSQGDFTANGVVDAADLNALALNWQQAIPMASPVPEPAASLLAMCGIAVLLGRIRKAGHRS